MKVIDLSGYSFTGKSAVFDFLSEFKGYRYHSKNFEFELLRTAGGITDLEQALVKNWSPVRSAEAIRKFKKLIKSYAGTNQLWSRLTSIGFQYDSYFPSFTKDSESYVNSLIEASWQSDWPFVLPELPLAYVIYLKVKSKLKFKTAFEFDVYLSRLSDEEFTALTQEYLQNIFSSCMSSNDKAIVINNAFEPFFPFRVHKYFSDPKSIIVDRDPRDVYMSAIQQGVVGGTNVGKAVIGSSVEDFIKRFLVYRKNNDNDGDNVFKISFEKLVLDYEVSKVSILNFLGEDESIHVSPKKHFDPEQSSKGIGLWKQASGKVKQDIEVITSELKNYCVEI